MKQSVIIFDGVCKLCHFSVNFIIQRDPDCQFIFSPLQSDTAKKLCAQYNIDNISLNTLVLIQDERYFIRSRAAFEICKKLTGAWYLLSAFAALPSAITDLPYRLIARFRYQWFGKYDTCSLPSPELGDRFIE